MPPDQPDLAHEWATLQNNIEQYERNSLLIKLVAVTLGLLLAAFGPAPLGIGAVLVLWLQEGIFRTSQARLGARIEIIEARARSDAGSTAAFQLHTDWHAQRPGTAGLLAECARNALRPTVAYPYAVLLMLTGLVLALG